MPAQQEIELILMRELSSYLAMPIFLVDPDANLLFYNEPAEAILGLRFDETGEMTLVEWADLWAPVDAEGNPVPADGLPLVRALQTGRPVTGSITIQGADGIRRDIEIAALPLIGQSGRNLGAAAIFWQRS